VLLVTCTSTLPHSTLTNIPVKTQQGLVDRAGETIEDKFKADLYQREINRVVYLLKSYLRTRFLKITRHAKFILTSNEMMSRLSKAEAELVVVPYVNLSETHLKSTFLNDLPEKFQGVSDKNGSDPSMIESPNLDEYVFCQVTEDVGQVQVSDDDIIDLNAGDIYAVRYRTIQGFLEEGKVHLV
jgi:GINS complex subunit 4